MYRKTLKKPDISQISLEELLKDNVLQFSSVIYKISTVKINDRVKIIL